MPDALPVHVNRDGLHSLELPGGFEATGSFDVRLINHGEAIHVHLHLDDALSEVASLEANNHYVQGNSERLVGIEVREGATARGSLKVVSSYGAETRYVDVQLTEPEEETREVQVDESLSRPQPRPEPDDDGGIGPETPVLLFGGLAILIAAGVSVLVPSTPVRLGAVAVFVAVLVALYLVRE